MRLALTSDRLSLSNGVFEVESCRAPAVQLYQQELGGKATEDFGNYAGVYQGNEHCYRIKRQSLLG